MRFVSLDFETANPDLGSICQVGMVQFENGSMIDVWSSLVNPRDFFARTHTAVHGISEADVADAPEISDVLDIITQRIEGQIVATHTVFDRNAIARAAARTGTKLPDCSWIDTTAVARRVWPEVSRKGYGLAALAKRLGIEFKHHVAVEDARVSGLILLAAMRDGDLDLPGLLNMVQVPLGAWIKADSAVQSNDPDPEGPLWGEVLVITGTLRVPRREATVIASKAGCEVASGVTKATTMLLVGDQDIRALNGHDKSSKHRKAEELIAEGQEIRIITESDFLAMVK